MRHKLLGASGLRVSELCLGTLTFGESKSWGADRDTSTAILSSFAEAGGTFIDTAPNYGDGRAEEIVGDFVAGDRNGFVIATKYTASHRPHPLAGGNSRRSMILSVEQSLARLKTDRIDLLWLHYWDGTTPSEEILRAADDLVRSGKVVYLGFSDVPAWIVSRASAIADLRGWNPIAAIQIEYNLVARSAERELLPMAEALDLGIVCWGALAGGALAAGPEPRRRAPEALSSAVAAATARLRNLGDESGLEPATLALRWLLQRSGAPVPVFGARTADQLKTTLAAAGLPVGEALLRELDSLTPPELGFPHELIGSSYLRKLALGDPSSVMPPARARA